MRHTFGVALGGGGLRGLAHIGVLKALHSAGVTVDCVAGTSMGGLVGATCAAGINPDAVQERLGELSSLASIMRLIDWSPGTRALISGRGLLAYFADLLGPIDTFEELTLPFACVAVDLETGEEVVLREGNLIEALNCTIALPGIFDPVERDGRLLIDGGVRNNVPADVTRQLGAEVVLAVDVSVAGLLGRIAYSTVAKRWTIAKDLWRSQYILIRAVTELRLQAAAPDFLIRPVLPEGITTFSGISRLAEIVDAGERAAVAILPRLLAALEAEPASQPTWRG